MKTLGNYVIYSTTIVIIEFLEVMLVIQKRTKAEQILDIRFEDQ